MLETSLYPAVKQFLESAGFHVKGEVNGCDAVAVRDGQPERLAVVEMKRGFASICCYRLWNGCAVQMKYGWLFQRRDVDAIGILASGASDACAWK
jgi:hypothetical protein